MKRAASLTITIILLCGLSISFAAPKKMTHSVSIDNMKFEPADLQITVGDSVEWTNNDDRDHNVTAKDGSFKSSNLSVGATYKYSFKTAGKFAYGCSLHPRMKASVTVAP
ncbi:MAG: cupredoxin family copper-binding protein [Anaerolineae bacterium]|nr:cupredoxin family copper-binding protein [Phycisphaerae bacterium]